jgi:hypothetical protein
LLTLSSAHNTYQGLLILSRHTLSTAKLANRIQCNIKD